MSDFKIVLITFKSLHGLAPGYILDLLIPPSAVTYSQILGQYSSIPPKITISDWRDRDFSPDFNDLIEDIRLLQTVSS